MSDINNEPKTDCFAYDKTMNVPRCNALVKLFCKEEECRFYKPGKWRDICNGGNGKN